MGGAKVNGESGRGSARLERTVRVREDGGSNPPAPTVTCPLRYHRLAAGIFISTEAKATIKAYAPPERSLSPRQAHLSVGEVRVESTY